MNRDQVLGIVRHILTFGGGFVVAKGYANAELIATMVGAVITLVGGIWSIAAPEKKA